MSLAIQSIGVKPYNSIPRNNSTKLKEDQNVSFTASNTANRRFARFVSKLCLGGIFAAGSGLVFKVHHMFPTAANVLEYGGIVVALLALGMAFARAFPIEVPRRDK